MGALYWNPGRTEVPQIAEEYKPKILWALVDRAEMLTIDCSRLIPDLEEGRIANLSEDIQWYAKEYSPEGLKEKANEAIDTLPITNQEKEDLKRKVDRDEVTYDDIERHVSLQNSGILPSNAPLFANGKRKGSPVKGGSKIGSSRANAINALKVDATVRNILRNAEDFGDTVDDLLHEGRIDEFQARQLKSRDPEKVGKQLDLIDQFAISEEEQFQMKQDLLP